MPRYVILGQKKKKNHWCSIRKLRKKEYHLNSKILLNHIDLMLVISKELKKKSMNYDNFQIYKF